MSKASELVFLVMDDPALDELMNQVNDENAIYDWADPVEAPEGEVYLFWVITKGYRYSGTGIGISSAIRTCGEAFSEGLRQRWP